MIELVEVHKGFDRTSVLRGLEFVAPDGAITGLVGPNGAGKSTAFKIIAGVMNADRGQVLIDGRQNDPNISETGRRLSLFLGGSTIPPSMTGESYLHYISDLVGASREEIAERLGEVGLGAAGSRPVREYSMGMKQRLGVAGALLGNPRNIVLDEPVNGFDIEGVRWMRGVLRDLASNGVCVLLSSHMLSELELVADNIVVLSRGVARRAEALSDMLVNDDVPLVVVSTDLMTLKRHLKGQGMVLSIVGEAIHVVGEDANTVAAAVLSSGVGLISIAPMRRSIEDVYVEEVMRHVDP